MTAIFRRLARRVINALWKAPNSGIPSTRFGKRTYGYVKVLTFGQDATLSIGARAVATKDVPPYSIVAGNPARWIRNWFDEQTIRRLLALKWWDWDDEKTQRYIPMLRSPEVGAFLDAAEAEGRRG